MRQNVTRTDEEITKALEAYPESFWNTFDRTWLQKYRDIDKMIIIVQKLLNADSQKFPELDKTVLKEILDLLTFYKIRGRTDYNLRNSFP